MMFDRKPTAKVRKLEKRILDLEATINARDRQLAVLEAERDALAGVIARDRQRVQAEAAAYARQRAESEGNENGRNQASPGR